MAEAPDSGKRLGPYVLKRKLGEGGMGAVYEAERVGDVLEGTLVKSVLDLESVATDQPPPMQPGQRVALKLLRAQLTSNKEFVDRFWREAKIVTALNHDNIVRGLDAGQADDAYYFAMEFVEGRSVGGLLELEGALPEQTAVEIILQVARGLEYAHQHKLIHRDIKPDNIMLTPEGHAKLADFGLARSVAADATQLTAAGQIMGTPYYIAPEQARAENVDIRSDIYSLGATFYHMVTGKTPFEASSAIALITKCLNETPETPKARNPENVSDEVSAIVMKMMEKEPENRYQTPAELASALEAVHKPADDMPELSISYMSMGDMNSLKSLMQKAMRKEDALKPSEELTMPGPPPSSAKKSTGSRKKAESSADILNDPLLDKVPVVDGCKRIGNVVLLQKLGQGGMGAVYRGRHMILDIDVAVKVMIFPPTLSDDQQEMLKQRFIREARIAIQLEHPGIVRTYEIGEEKDSGLTYIVMEFVPGRSAADLVKDAREKGAQITEKTALNIVRQAAEALASAHKVGVVHRDIKPGNLLIRESDEAVKIADMGLAKSLGNEEEVQMTRSDSALGTPAYMAPEQASSAKDVGPACDIYALGATLYNLATGRVPFEGNSLFEILTKVVNTPPPSITGQRPDMTANIENIVQKAMAKKPEDRYETAQDMADDLGRALQAIGAGSVVIASNKVLGLDRKQLPLILSIAGGVAAILIAVVLVLALMPEEKTVIVEKPADPQVTVPVEPKEDPQVVAAKNEIAEIEQLIADGKLQDALARAKLGETRFKGMPIAAEFSRKRLELREALARKEMDRVTKLTEEKKYDEAIRIAKAAAETYNDTTLSGQFRLRASEIHETHARAQLEEILALVEAGDLKRAVELADEALVRFKDTAAATSIRQEKRNIRNEMARKELSQISALVDAKQYDTAIERAERGVNSYGDTDQVERFRDKVKSIRKIVAGNVAAAAEAKKREARKKEHDRLVAKGKLKLAAGDNIGALAEFNTARGIIDSEETRRLIQDARMAMAETEMKATRFDKALELLIEASSLLENPKITSKIQVAKKAASAKRELDQATDRFRAADYDEADRRLDRAKEFDPGYLGEQIASLKKRIADERASREALAAAKEARATRSWKDIAEAAAKVLEVKPDNAEATALLDEAKQQMGLPPETSNALGMRFVLVPGGRFTMGSETGDPDEKPVRTVALDSYYISAHEVTNKVFEQYQPDHRRRRTGVSKLDECPAVNVSWQEAQAFCRWLTKRTGVRHRLPTEAEWEFAAKGFESWPYPWGETPPKPEAKIANWGEGKKARDWAKDGFAYTSPVGSFPSGASQFGCLDMAGNVWEWVADWYAPYPATTRVVENPTGPRAGGMKVIRGGSWYHDAAYLRTANRASKKPSKRSDLIGFRIVMEAGQ